MTIQSIGGYIEYNLGKWKERAAVQLLLVWLVLAENSGTCAHAQSTGGLMRLCNKPIMGLVGASDCTKRDESKLNIIFAVGLGSFI